MAGQTDLKHIGYLSKRESSVAKQETNAVIKAEQYTK